MDLVDIDFDWRQGAIVDDSAIDHPHRDLQGKFTAFFDDETSIAVGSQFKMEAPFQISGDANVFTQISFTLDASGDAFEPLQESFPFSACQAGN